MITRAIRLAAALLCCLMTGCENSLLDRSLVFFTNTTIGLEISVSPSEATSPAKIIVGYKRAEGVLNPVYHSEGVEGPARKEQSQTLAGGSSERSLTEGDEGGNIKRYRWEAYSVIAKIAGEVSGKAAETAQGGLSVAQWFATGEAAKILAKQPGIAGAVTGSSEIAKAAAQESAARKLTGDASLRAEIVMVQIYNGLTALAEHGDKQAAVHITALDALGQLAPEAFTEYAKLPTGVLTPRKVPASDLRPNGKVTFKTFSTNQGALRNSINLLSQALKEGTFQYKETGGDAGPVTPEQRAKLSEVLALQQALQRNLAREVARNKATVKAIIYYCDVLTK